MSARQRVVVLQLQSNDRIEDNLKQIESLLSSVKKQSETTLVCLPENSLYMRILEGEKIQGLDLDHFAFQSLQRCAREKNLLIHIGSAPLNWKGKLSNSSVLIWPNGKIEASYQKIHLFDIELEGQSPIRESDVFHHGDDPQVLSLAGWKIGQTICYDLRFSELFSLYAKEQVEALLVPAAFLKKTGEAHWHVLLRARAIENQCYVVAAAQAGQHRSAHQNATRETYGHSLIIDPWGKIVAEGSADRPEALLVTLDRSEVEKVRRQIPMASHRRL